MIDSFKKKLQTTFIGDLAEFEKGFGFLWGHGKPFGQLNPDERYFRKIWTNVRKNILDKGNNQITNVDVESELYEIRERRFNYNIPIKRRGE